MSDAVFPTLPGATIKITRTPVFAGKTAYSASQRAQSVSYAAYPLWKLTLEYEFLRSGAEQELQQLVGFFMQRRGSWDTFLFDDPDDGSVTSQQIGTGDGTTTSFQLVRSFGGFLEPVTAPISLAIYDGTELQYAAPLPHQNLVGNAGFDGDTSGIFISWNESGTVISGYGRDFLGASWHPVGMHTFGAGASGSPTGNLDYQLWEADVTAGQRYCVAAYIASHRSAARMKVTWVDSGGGFVGAELFTPATPNNTSKFGGTDLANWQLCYAYANAPAGAAKARIKFNAFFNGQDGPFWWVLHPDFYAAPADQASPYAWCPDVPDYTLSGGVAAFAIPPTSGDPPTWTGTYRRRCRFVQSELETERFLYNLYKCGKVELITDKG